MSEHDLMQVAEMISALGLIENEETDEVAIELTVLAKLAVRFPDVVVREVVVGQAGLVCRLARSVWARRANKIASQARRRRKL